MFTAFILLGIIFLLFACKQEQKEVSAPMEKIVEASADTVIPEEEVRVEIEGGLHMRLHERFAAGDSIAQQYIELDSLLKYNEGPLTLLLPDHGLNDCEDCLQWTDVVIDDLIDSPYISNELNGLRVKFDLKSLSGQHWEFTKRGDSLIANDHFGASYLLWQTDIKAANGLLHILKEINSQ